MFHGFIGEYYHSMDAKNRVMVPAKFREAFTEKDESPEFYITRGPERCLLVYTPDQWNHWEETLDEITDVKNLKGSVRHYHRAVYAGARHIACDKLGRIVIPQVLADHAGLANEVVFVGVKRRMEIWSGDVWKKYQEKIFQDYEALTDQIYE